MQRILVSIFVVALVAAIGAADAMAQTVIVRGVPPSTKVDAQVNGGAVASATADANGDAKLAAAFPSRADEVDVRFFVDVCSPEVQVQILSPGLQPPPAAAGCNRNEIWGVFVMRRVTTFVVDVEGASASMHITQGPPPASWVGRAQSDTAHRFFQTTPPLGVVVFGALGIPTFSNTLDTACGTATTCSHDSFTGAGAIGATYWIKSFLGAQITLAKPGDQRAFGSGSTFQFSSTLDSRLVTIAGIGAVPVGAVRLYGLGGTNYHRATFATSETISDPTLVVLNSPQRIEGGTQTFEHRTEGWSWLFGGGLEAWVTKSVGFYGEMQHARLKAPDVGSSEGGIDDHLTLIVFGARVRLF